MEEYFKIEMLINILHYLECPKTPESLNVRVRILKLAFSLQRALKTTNNVIDY